MQRFRPEVAARLGELAPHLFDRLDAMTDRMVEVLLRTEPAYRDLAVADASELRRSVRAGLERGVRGLIGATSGDPVTMQAKAHDVGRRRAAQGVPLEAVLRAYRLGGQVTWETLLAVSQDRGTGHDTLLLEVAGSVWRTNDVECGAVAEGYREEQRRLAAAGDAARQRVLDGLLDGRGGDPAFVRSASELLGVSLEGRLLAVVAPSDSSGEPTLADPGPGLARRGVRSVWGTRSGAQVGVLMLGVRRTTDVLTWLSAMATGPVGVSDVVEGAAAAAGAYRLAETAARTLPSGDRRVVTIDDRLPEALLSNSPEISSRLVDRSLGRLLELPEDEQVVLLDTLAAFLAADGSPTRAADELYCHRNTVMHRLRRIESVTGHKVTDPRARLLWQLALLGAGTQRPARHPA
ncbi:PucR family transcriptional regulator [Geodermatophilus sp. DF01-2]|uniref:PucR family transcriptional regulator n=1 Tax=Geodermatophilus sp. DF01-2 TaxID=2559610 RepID=UPI001073A7DA|nr:PucR family transcriptional regulator [Geodermatophilus sp. DF01_2]TFV61667.1 PucR family transcriptional regulator [Geodermatophilus sp. DF01_2]